jgi:hypothetical protein
VTAPCKRIFSLTACIALPDLRGVHVCACCLRACCLRLCTFNLRVCRVVSTWTGLVLDALLGNMIELGPGFRVTAVFHGTMQVPASAVWTQYPSGHVDLVRAPLARLPPHAPVSRCAA